MPHKYYEIMLMARSRRKMYNFCQVARCILHSQGAGTTHLVSKRGVKRSTEYISSMCDNCWTPMIVLRNNNDSGGGGDDDDDDDDNSNNKAIFT